jgi:uncharacterized protein with beta-barrel porin domain
VSAGKLLINGDNHSATAAVTVSSAGTLGGNGSIGGATTINGKLAPGPTNGIGTLSFSNNLTLASASALQMEISKTPKTNDALLVAGTLALNGSLTVSNLAGAPALGDSFKLFTATTISGNFNSVTLPQLTTGLAWNKTTLTTSGVISVVTNPPPRVVGLGVNGTSLIFSGSNGVAGNTYYVIATTNLAQPVAQWAFILTNTFDASGNFNCTNPFSAGTPQKFYRLLVPGN